MFPRTFVLAAAAPLMLASATTLLAASPAPPAPPATERKPVTDTYHGVEVIDDYRWLEDWSDPAVRQWSDAQNAHARAFLDALPDAPAIRARVEQVLTAPSVRHYDVHRAGDRLLAMRRESGRQQPILVAFDDAAAVLADKPVEPRILLDPAALPGGAAIDWFVASPDGSLVAVSVSLAGTESGDVRVLNIADGSQVGEIVPRVNGGTAGGSLAWTPDGKGYFYTRYPRAGERPDEDMGFFVTVYHHQLGSDGRDDRYEIGAQRPRRMVYRATVRGSTLSTRADLSSVQGIAQPAGHQAAAGGVASVANLEHEAFIKSLEKLAGDDPAPVRDFQTAFEFPRIAEILLESDHRGRVLATVQDGDGGFFAVYLRDPEGYWSRIANYPDRVVQATLGPDDALYMVSRKDAPRGRLLRLALPTDEAADAIPTLADARIIVPEQPDTLVSEFFEPGNICITENHLYLTYQLGGPSEIRVFDHAGKPLKQPGQPSVTSAGGLAHVGPDTVLYSVGSFVQPVTWFMHAAEPGKPAEAHTLAALSTRTAFDYSTTRSSARWRPARTAPRCPSTSSAARA